MPTRCFMPPEISEGRLSAAWVIWTRARFSIAHSWRSRRDFLLAKTLSTANRTFS